MTREIKFRAWDKSSEVWVDPKYQNVELSAIFALPFYEFQQFTGLTDKNGKEIYEGDIVKCYQAQGLGFVTGIVHFGIEDRSGWPDPRIYLDTRPFQEHNGSEFCIFHKSPEIIGNIYENPDLLTEPT